MSGKRNKKIRKVLRKQVRETVKDDYAELYDYLCTRPFKQRCRSAWNILIGCTIKEQVQHQGARAYIRMLTGKFTAAVFSRHEKAAADATT